MGAKYKLLTNFIGPTYQDPRPLAFWFQSRIIEEFCLPNIGMTAFWLCDLDIWVVSSSGCSIMWTLIDLEVHEKNIYV